MEASKKISLCCRNRKCPEAIIAKDEVIIRGEHEDFVIGDNTISLVLNREQVERIYNELIS